MFKRRDKRSWWATIRDAVYPRGGWTRAAYYVKHRLHRLPDPPEKIARGIFAGVFTTFSPFYGLHFLVAAALAWVMRGNIIAALLSTFFGNPLTYVPIGIISMRTGYWLLGIDGSDAAHGTIGRKFTEAGRDLWDNFVAIFTPARADWSDLKVFYDEVFFPYMIGGIIPGILAGLICYYLAVPVIRVYQNRRKGAIKEKLAALKAKKKSSDSGSAAD